MATYQLVFNIENRRHRKVKSFNPKRLMRSACLMIFFLWFGLTQDIANAANDSSNPNLDLLDCAHDEKVRLFLEDLFCIKRGSKKITKKQRAKTISDNLASFAKNLEVSPEDLILEPCQNNSQTCFYLSYKKPDLNKNINITSIENQDIQPFLLREYDEQNQELDLKRQIQTVIIPNIKKAVRNFRKSQCQLPTQAVTIKLKNHQEVIFCIKTSIRANENISERAKRVTEKIRDIQSGKINVETLGILPVSELKEKLDILEFDNLTDDIQKENTEQKQDVEQNSLNSQSLAIVSYQENLNPEEKIIFVLTKLDLELINSKYNNSYTTFQGIDNFFQKIVTFVRLSDSNKSTVEREAVNFNWGPYNNFLFRRFSCLKTQLIECQSDLFKVHDKAGFYNSSYRAITIENKITAVANQPWRIFSNPKLDIQSEEYQSIIRVKKYNDQDYFNLMTIATNEKAKDNVKGYALIVSSTIQEAIHIYRYNQWLVLEILFLSVANIVYFFYLEKAKQSKN